MAAGSSTQIVGRERNRVNEARVTDFRLWVNAAIAAGGTVGLTVEVTEDDVVPANPQLLPIAAEVDIVLGVLPEADGDWTHLRVNAFGMLWVDMLANGQTGDAAGANPFALMVAGVDSAGDQQHLTLNDSGHLNTLDRASIQESDVALSNPFLLPGGGTRDDALSALPEPQGDWVRFRVDSVGALWVTDQAIITEGTQATTTAGTYQGTPVFTTRDDDLSGPPAHVVDGDSSAFRSDSRGALWVREATVSDHLSGSTNGRPIAITTVATLGDTLHTAIATAGLVDKVWIFASNVGTTEETLTIEFGAAGAGNEMKIPIPCGDLVLVVPGWAIGGAASQVITAYATTANVINVTGYFERHVNP